MWNGFVERRKNGTVESEMVDTSAMWNSVEWWKMEWLSVDWGKTWEGAMWNGVEWKGVYSCFRVVRNAWLGLRGYKAPPDARPPK